MEDIIHISSITEVYDFFETEKPPHPLITILREWPKALIDQGEIKFSSDLYLIGLKKNIRGNFKYGRSSYDYQEGTMVFMGPGQVATFSFNQPEARPHGWTLLFHPDLIRKTHLGQEIHRYSFFNYEISEALHLSSKEQKFVNNLVDTIETEVNQNMDRHSQELIVQNVETVLKYGQRYYDRQFYTRSNLNKNLVTKFEQYLHTYFQSTELMEKGPPSLDQCGEELNLSGAYLSDLLRTETGRSAKDHINAFLIEKAKTTLLQSKEPVSQIAYQFGFEYPQNFSKLFKSKTGMSPSEYRNLN